MILPSIVDRYVFREVCISFLFCFSLFVTTGLVAGFLPILRKSWEVGLGLTLMLFQVLIHVLPSTMATVLPLSITIGVLLGLGRLAADNEIAALKASGVSIIRLFPPVLLLGLIGLVISLLCTLYLVPRGISEGHRLTREALFTRADAGIEEHTFFDALKNVIVYVDSKDPDTGIMHHVFIQESSDPEDVRTITAKRGKSIPDPERKAFVIYLRDGTILRENSAGELTGSLAFESYEFRYPIERAGFDSSLKSFEEDSIAEIRRRVAEATTPKEGDTAETRAYHARVKRMAGVLTTQRFVHPMACLALAFLAFPLGVMNMGRSRLNNVSLGLVAIFAYYMTTLATERAARSGLAPPEIVMSLTPVIFLAGACYLMWCTNMERMPGFINTARRLIIQARGQAL